MIVLSPRLKGIAESVSSFEIFASCVAFFCLGVAQPILDLLGNNPEFFLSRSSPLSDVLLLGISLGLIAPTLVGLAVIGIRRVNVVAGTVVHVVILGTLALLLLIEIVEHFAPDSLLRSVVAGAVGGSAAVALFYGSPAFRFILKVVVLAPVAVLVSFAVLSPLSRLIFVDHALAGPISVTVGNPVPIVMVVFDEFPIASLMDGVGTIQADNYPNYARLARDSYWFRNAVTNESNTERALPSILTGARAKPEGIPVVADYPGNLFTLLDGIYEIDAIEDLTDLCPESACQIVDDKPWQERWAETADDLRILALHVVLPKPLTRGLPPIDQSWSDYRAQQLEAPMADDQGGTAEFDIVERFHSTLDKGRQPSFTQFLDQLGPSDDRPSFDFIHVLLPHSPWEYLQDGTRHGAPQPARGTEGSGWSDDSWLVDQIYQRHLLQVQYTDTLIGQMIDRLEDLDVYDNALIVVLADHGIVIAPGVDHRRRLAPDRIGELTAVPLFIKPPGGVDGVIDDYRAELIDVLPTMTDILDAEIPWSSEGISLLRSDRPAREESVINSGELVIGAGGREKLEVAQRKIEIFGPGSPFDLAPRGSRDLLWTNLDELEIEPAAPVVGEVSNLFRYEDIDLDAEILPAYVQGILERDEADAPVIIAISVNGVISAVTQSYVRDELVRFQAIVPRDAFKSGVNDLRLILVDGSGPQRALSFVRTG